jgi:DUF1365 family protein
MHHRLAPKVHRFNYQVFMFYIDLGELPLLRKKLLLFGHNRFNMFSFKDSDHLQLPAGNPDTAKTTRQHITSYLQQNGITLGTGRIMLLTNLSVLGYNFNPVSFYFCYDSAGQPLCCVAEVSNTFREMKPYLLGPENLLENKFYLNTKKYFYVSPFINHDTDFDFNLAIPADRLNIRIDDYEAGERIFVSTLTGTKKTLTNRALLWYSIRFPFITLKVITLIHWNALLLWVKRLPYHRKGENRHLQKNVYRKYNK